MADAVDVRDHERLADPVGRLHDGDGLPVGLVLGHVDVVDPFQFQRVRRVQFHNDRFGETAQRGGDPDTGRGDEVPLLGDGMGFDHGHVDGTEVTVADFRGYMAQVLVVEPGCPGVDLVAELLVGLVGHPAVDGAHLRQRSVELVTDAGAGEQVDARLLAGPLDPLGQGFGYQLGVAGRGETAAADIHAVLNQAGGFLRRGNFVEQFGMTNSVFHRMALLQVDVTVTSWIPACG